jgi:hypothetical protein
MTANTLPAVPSLFGPKTLPALAAKGGGHPLPLHIVWPGLER